MKKIYILLICFSFTVLSFAQKTVTKETQAKGQKLEEPDNLQLSDRNLKADGDVFWTETFDWANPDDPKGWSLPDGWTRGDETDADLGYDWIWRNDSIFGYYTSSAPPTWTETPEDGFIVLPVDEYNYVDGVRGFETCYGWIQTPPIDCSDKPSVVVNLQQLFRHCCTSAATLKMKVTNDDGVHWAEYDMNFDTAVNDWINVDLRKPAINVSNVAAGHSEVMIRFEWEGSRLYFWLIDDMKLSEAYHNELKMENSWAFFDNGNPESEEGFINYIPLSQLNENFGSYSFSSAVINSGIDDQTGGHLNVEVLKNGVSVYNENSEVADINTLDRDTFNITTPFIPDDYADYSFRFNNIMDNDDQIAENNSGNKLYTVNDSVYMRGDKTRESAAGTSGWVGGKMSGDAFGNIFTLTSAVEASSITALVWGIGGGAPTSTANELQFVLFEEDLEGDEEWIERITTDLIEVVEDEDEFWITMPLDKDGEVEFLEPGNYLVGAIAYGNGIPDDALNHGNQDIRLGYDKDTYTPSTKPRKYLISGDGWSGNNGKLFMIGLNTTERGGPTIAPVTFNVDMNEEIAESLFNPASDFIDVTGTFNDWSGSEAFTDVDGDGIYTLTVPDLSTGETIEYKYRINANDLTSEADNRSYEVRYWNVLDNTYIFNASSVVDNHDIVEKLIVYPNPTNGMINIVVNNTKQSDLIIEMRDVQGQLIYSNSVIAVLNHREVIDINPAKGMYFLSVNDGSDIKVKKVIVQ